MNKKAQSLTTVLLIGLLLLAGYQFFIRKPTTGLLEQGINEPQFQNHHILVDFMEDYYNIDCITYGLDRPVPKTGSIFHNSECGVIINEYDNKAQILYSKGNDGTYSLPMDLIISVSSDDKNFCSNEIKDIFNQFNIDIKITKKNIGNVYDFREVGEITTKEGDLFDYSRIDYAFCDTEDVTMFMMSEELLDVYWNEYITCN